MSIGSLLRRVRSSGRVTPTSNVSTATVLAPGASTPRSLAVRAGDVVNVKDFGAVGDGVTDDTDALDAARDRARATGAELFIPPGIYVRTEPLLVYMGMRLRGASQYGRSNLTGVGSVDNFRFDATASVIKNTAGGSVIEVTDATNTNPRVLEIGHLAIQGPDTDSVGHVVGAGHGIYIHDNADPGGPAEMYLHDLQIASVGGRGVYATAAWNTEIARTTVHNSGSHAFDVYGGNTTLLSRCYARWVGAYASDPYPAAYRIHRMATLIACNGVDAGWDWGVFGDAIADGDAQDMAAFITMIGCNVEAAHRYGVHVKPGGHVALKGNTFVGYNMTSPNPIALYLRSVSGGMEIDDSNQFLLNGGGAAWANGHAIHVTGTSRPLVKGNISGVWNGTAVAAWDVDGGIATALAGVKSVASAFHVYPLGVSPGNQVSNASNIYAHFAGSSAWTGIGTIAAGGTATKNVTTAYGYAGWPAMGAYFDSATGAGLPAGITLHADMIAQNTCRITLRNNTGDGIAVNDGTVIASAWRVTGSPQ